MLLSLASQYAVAASFQLHEQSVTYLGNAFSGTASTAEDASTNYYNPAGLTKLKNPEAVLSGIYVRANVKLYNAHATNDIGGNLGYGITDHPKGNAVIPGVHLSANLNNRWSVGFSVVAPFGLNTRYSSTSIARYMSTKSKINTVDITPAVAFKFNEQFSVGAGFDAMYVTATLDQALFFGVTEGYIQNTAHAWTYGYHVGGIYQPSCSTRMGLVYFSSFSPTLKGHDYTLGFPSAVPPTTLRAQIVLPERLVYSITHNFSDKWSGMADVEWVHWSKLQHLFLQYNTGIGSYYKLENKNTWRVALGANYKYTDNFTFKGGLAWDQSPVQQQYRISALPDSDRYWIAVGIKFRMNKYAAFDVGYSHLFFKTCTIQQTANFGALQHVLTGNYKGSADLVGMQLTWNFV